MTTIIIGNFDGVHIGHQGLIRRARHLSQRSEVATHVGKHVRVGSRVVEAAVVGLLMTGALAM